MSNDSNSRLNPKLLAALVAGAALIIIAVVVMASGAKHDAATPEQAMQTPPSADAAVAATPADAANNDPFTWNDTPQAVPATVFKDAADTDQTLSNFSGKVLVVNFWATWCAPCVKEMPTLDALQGKLGGADFQVLTISQDREGAKVAKPFIDKNQWKNLALYVEAPGHFARDAKLRGLPTSLIIDKSGHEVARVEGELKWDSPEVEKILRDLIAKG